MEQNEAAAVIDALFMSGVITMIQVPNYQEMANVVPNLDTEDKQMTRQQFIEEILAVEREDGMFLVRPAYVFGFFILEKKRDEHRRRKVGS